MDDYKIYPKQFRTTIIPTEKNTCFMLMPFQKDFDQIYGVIKNDLSDVGIVCNRADEISGSKPILNKILTEILKSQYIIVDLTGYNPNVFYELGISHVFKDAQHILLIKQRDSKVPFDLTHLTYIEYEKNNLKYLTSTIREFIKENKYVAEFHEILNIRGIIDVIHENKSEFVDYIQNYFGENISKIISLINLQHDGLSESDVEMSIYEYLSMIDKIIKEKSLEILPGILKVYYEILISCSRFGVTDVFVSNFLGDYFDKYPLMGSDVLSHKTDLAIMFADKKKKLNIVMPWIIDYFSRSKSGTIDLNRYKIESFLMTTPYAEINKIIECAVFDENCYIREHMADIIGEKRLYDAKDNLFKQLTSEENIFSVASLITAIGKLGDPEGILYINRWISENEEEIIKTKQFFVMKRAANAMMKLDRTKVHVNAFNERYSDYLQNYFLI